jgi:putative Mg2+ transporter-C (MgtC) family protein
VTNPIELLSTASGGQTLIQLGELSLALVLSTAIGLEREFRMKSAGLRTHTLVGVAAALIMLVSKYGFSDVIQKDLVVLDPSRVAAQIVTGIGFIGGGVIFVQRDIVRGLTTAAAVWLTASVGMACGAGLPILAIFVTASYFLVMYAYTTISRRIISAQSELVINYQAGKGTVREIMKVCGGRALGVNEIEVHPGGDAGEAETRALHVRLRGRGGLDALVIALSDLPGVISVNIISPRHGPE